MFSFGFKVEKCEIQVILPGSVIPMLPLLHPPCSSYSETIMHDTLPPQLPQCRLGLGRIKLQRNKRLMQLNQSRKDVAEQIRSGKIDYAKIRVEGVIREQLMLQAYEVG